MTNQRHEPQEGRYCWKRLALFAGTVVFLLPGNARSAEMNFRAEGHVEITFHGGDGKEQKRTRYPFSVARSNDTWRVEGVQPMGPALASLYRKGVTAGTVAERTAGFVVPVVIHNTGYPVGTYYEQIPWFAFLGAEVLQTNRAIHPPWSSPQMDPEAHMYLAEHVRDEATGLLLAARFVADAQRVKSAPASPLLVWFRVAPVDRHRRKAGYRAARPGAVGGTYTLLESTNVGGFGVPLKFRIENYRVAGRVGSTGILARRFEGVVTNLVVGGTSPAPPPEVSFDMFDYRYQRRDRGVEYIYYPATNLFEAFPSTLRLQQLEAQAKLNHRVVFRDLQDQWIANRNPYVILLMVVFVILPIVFFGWFFARRR